MTSYKRPKVTTDELSSWCRASLGVPVRDVLFERGYSSAVFGVTLADDRQVVVKVRPGLERLISCGRVHRDLWERGFRCPEPLGPPERVSAWAVSFESYVPDGEELPRGLDAAVALARVLAELVQCAPTVAGSLEPHWGFLRWGHPGSELWPPATDIVADLNEFSEPGWIEHCAAQLRVKLTNSQLPGVVGHGDWWSDNVRWKDGQLLAVDDWDSLVVLPEAGIAGAAAALFAGGASTIEETDTFLRAYIAASGRAWTDDEIRIAWAAGLWARLFDARKETTWGSTKSAVRLAIEVEERSVRSGIETYDAAS
jgi:hypothetical protein